MEQEQAKFEGWAIVEMMGHQKEIGYVTTEAYGVAVLFRVDVPEIPSYEFILKRPEYGLEKEGSERYLAVGTKVQRAGTPARSRLVSPAAIYAINPCTEEAAKAAIQASSSRRLVCIELPKPKILPMPTEEVSERTCEECGATPEEGHAPGCQFGQDEEESEARDILEGDTV